MDRLSVAEKPVCRLNFLSFVKGIRPMRYAETDTAGFAELTGMLYWMPSSSNQLAVTVCRWIKDDVRYKFRFCCFCGLLR